MVFGSLAIKSVSSRCVNQAGSPSLSQRKMLNWSGVILRCVTRWRKDWFNPYHARRSSGGRRLGLGAGVLAETLEGMENLHIHQTRDPRFLQDPKKEPGRK